MLRNIGKENEDLLGWFFFLFNSGVTKSESGGHKIVYVVLLFSHAFTQLVFKCLMGMMGPGPSQTNTRTLPSSRLRGWTPRRRLHGTLVSAWLISTRPRWRRMGLTTAAFGVRWQGLMVTAVLFVLSSSQTFHRNPWGLELGFSCTPAIYKLLGFVGAGLGWCWIVIQLLLFMS